MAYEAKLDHREPQPVLSIREKVSFPELSEKLGQFVGEVFGYLQGQGAEPAGPPFTRYHGFEGDKIDFEAGLPTQKALPGSGRIQPGELPGGPVVSTVHMGGYENLPQAGAALDSWVAENGREAAGANWEFYWVAPGHNADPSSWKTEVFKPVR
ncbi:MAG TPA: GyrI-like domain-containing protein [Thermoanaerobaculia bacterium]|nr:GyrI-like domain-containing protein [Thermoanaerobaculia bacterium]